MQGYKAYFSFVFTFLIFACNSEKTTEGTQNAVDPIFSLLSTEQTKVTFSNTLSEGPNTNILMYEYFYNGGGVATADFNNDGLDDIYFTSNMGENKLYLNKGKLQFEDIAQNSGTTGRPGPWKTGVSIVDINSDGLWDIYLCYSGALPAEKRANQLFINQGGETPTFTEEAEKYGIASIAYSNQGFFFDADKDGDLDMLLLNHNPKNLPILNVEATKEFKKKDSPEMGLRLFIQNNGKFTDQTQQRGINGSALSYGLGLAISDVNNDGWPDFYVSNDYSVPDYLYINNQNGTFTNQLEKQIGHTSQFSMGNNISDVNNDGLVDIFTLDMLPEGNERQKLLQAPDNFSAFDLNVKSGFYYQYMRNMLHLNNGNDTFSEIGQLSGISNTDWSWSPLFADFDNDGWKDLYITNGYVKDYTNQDFIKYMNNYVEASGRLTRDGVLEIIQKMPATNVVNYIFKNQKGIEFKNETEYWGTNQSSNSTGAAYTDLDNDGDLDLVVNNINKQAFIYQNLSSEQSLGSSLQIKLEGKPGNTKGIGTKVKIYSNGKSQYLEQNPNKGYLSAVSPTLHFGLEKITKVDSLIVIWPSGFGEKLENISEKSIVLNESNATEKYLNKPSDNKPIFKEIKNPITVANNTSNTQDFDRQSLLLKEFSHFAHLLVKGDVNNDGLEDILVGGDIGEPTQIYLQNNSGDFEKFKTSVFDIDKASQDRDALIFDANTDGLNDIYIASGGYHQFKVGDAGLSDRLYLANDSGGFEKSTALLPEIAEASSCVAANDINGDGFIDLFVGSNVVPGQYPSPATSYLLINNGKGKFSVKEKLSIGMVTDAEWIDLDQNGTKELFVVGEWMPLTVLNYKNGKLENTSLQFFDEKYEGLWTSISSADLNGDKKPDLVLGNIGLNTQFKANSIEPITIHYGDFDGNGTIDPIFSFYNNHILYPYVTRDELANQMPSSKAQFNNFKSFASVSTASLIDKGIIKSPQKLEVNQTKTSLFLSKADGKFVLSELPIQCQYSEVLKTELVDIDKDGDLDALLFGNNSRYKLKLGRFDANYGTVLLNDGKGNFTFVNPIKSGLTIKGEVGNSLIINKKLYVSLDEKGILSYTF